MTTRCFVPRALFWRNCLLEMLQHRRPKLTIWGIENDLCTRIQWDVRDWLKCAVLRYTLGRWDWLSLISVVHLAYFVVFGGFLGVCRSFLRQTPENIWKPPKNDEIGQMDNRNQARWVHLLNFIQKSNILFHCAILSFVILNSIQCLVERSNSQRPNV